MPMNLRTLVCTTITAVSVAASAHATRPLPGYQCLTLNLTSAEASDPNFMLTVRQAPSNNAPIIGTVGALIIAADPVVQQNGYIQITRPNAQTGWVPVSSTRPWRSPNPAASNVRCIPEIQDNGRVGFTTR